jgi:glutamate-5-semialdehyde dehydrogenase
MNVIEIATRAKAATLTLQSLPEAQRLMALEAIADALLREAPGILAENQKDLRAAAEQKLGAALVDRLTLTERAIADLARMCRAVGAQEQVVGTIVEEYPRPNGLLIRKQRIPLGVIGMIFESRPNVVVDGAALAIKSGNAIILKGGKEAAFSNRKLYAVIAEAIARILPAGAVSLVETREDVSELLSLHDYIDLVVPRGGSALIEFVRRHATMPVVAHDKGLCHVYVHADADRATVTPILLNAKTQRPGVCNAMETLLLHRDYPETRETLAALLAAGVELRGCPAAVALDPRIKPATPADYDTEYLAKILSVKLVASVAEAIDHVRRHGSRHTEAILAREPAAIEEFVNGVDAAAVVVNASTRFNDGGELGLGAELGISTSKLHAYGPMGAKEMTTTRFLVLGNGQTR